MQAQRYGLKKRCAEGWEHAEDVELQGLMSLCCCEASGGIPHASLGCHGPSASPAAGAAVAAAGAAALLTLVVCGFEGVGRSYLASVVPAAAAVLEEAALMLVPALQPCLALAPSSAVPAVDGASLCCCMGAFWPL